MRNRLMSMLVFTCIMGGALVYASEQSSSEEIAPTGAFMPFTGEIKGHRVRLRVAPHTDSAVIKELSKGDLVAVIGEKKDFYVIAAMDGMKGYVFRTFILDNTIEGEQVNVRSEPSTSAPILSRLSRGTQVSLTKNQPTGKWSEIELPSQCVLYIAKNFITNKGPVELYKKQEQQKKLAVNLLEQAQTFAKIELQKDLNDIDLEAIYKKINLLQDDEFKNVPNLSQHIQKILEEVQDAYLTKSMEHAQNVTASKPNTVSNAAEQATSVTSEPNKKTGSLLSRHIRKQIAVKTSPSLKGRETLEYSLFKIWVSMRSHGQTETLTIEDFYKDEQKKQQILTGELEPYAHVVKNNPGDFLLKNGETTVAFLYSTKIDLNLWVGKKISITCLPRPNNFFAFPAYYVTHIKEIS